MKNIKYIIAAVACVMFTACQNKDKWDVPASVTSPYENTSIKETNVLTIQQLKDKYYDSDALTIEGIYRDITEDIQVKGYVTCNDRTGNMYKEIAIQDATGALHVGINTSGVFGFLPEGEEILIDLKGLAIGNYRLGITIGTPYADKNSVSCVGRMPLSTWRQHSVRTGNRKSRAELDAMVEVFADCSLANPDKQIADKWGDMGKVDNSDAERRKVVASGGKLGIIKNVSIKEGGYYNSNTSSYVSGIKFVPGESKYVVTDAEDETWSTSWLFNEVKSVDNRGYTEDGAVQLYTSSYADFAATKLPTGKFNVIGVVKRYRKQWEFIVRDLQDIQEVK